MGGYLELAPRMIGSGRIEELIPLFVSAQQGLPNSAAILTRPRNALILTGRYAETVEAARKLLLLGPDASALCDMGMANMQHRRFPDAVDSLEQAVRLDPGFANAWMFLGFAYQMAARPEDAMRAFGRVLELSPSAKALSYWDKALRRTSDDAAKARRRAKIAGP